MIAVKSANSSSLMEYLVEVSIPLMAAIKEVGITHVAIHSIITCEILV